MRVCFSVGSSSERVINIMSTSMDNVEFFSYGSIGEMIHESTLRHIFFDRIVFSEKILEDIDNEFYALNEYIKEYSDSTTVVMICSNENSESIDKFSNVFDSPMYTAVVSPKVTVAILSELVNSDIMELKNKYLMGGKVNNSIKKKDFSENDSFEQSNKKGFLKGLFGSNKNKSLKNEIQNKDSNDSGNDRKVEESVENVGFKLPSGNFVADVGNAELVGAVPAVTGLGMSTNTNFSENGLSEGQVGSFNEGIKNTSHFNDDLGLGDYGEKHTDTGYLDEDEEEELKRGLTVNREPSNISSIEDFEKIYLGDDFNTSVRGINIITGERGVGVTTFVADYSVRLLEEGKRVLVVDFDYVKNGILSFINTNRFLKEGYMRGISSSKPFYDDGIAVISNGYGFGISDRDVLNIFNVSLNEYDIILIDCPLDCLDLLNVNMLRNSNVMIRVGGNRGSIISTIDGLTDKKKVSSSVEDELFKNSEVVVVNKIDEYDEDVAFLRKCSLFGRNDWLSKLS